MSSHVHCSLSNSLSGYAASSGHPRPERAADGPANARPGVDLDLLNVASSSLPTAYANFTVHAFRDQASGCEHLALVLGAVDDGRPVLTRIHSECLTGDSLMSLRCDCGEQLQAALRQIANEGRGILLYLRQEGRGIGLFNKIRAYALQDRGFDTVEANHQLGFAADLRSYDVCRPILEYLGVNAVMLMTNNPAKVRALEELGVSVTRRSPLRVASGTHNARYLAAKAARMGHVL
jgi:GTP cyclohydrolase II